MILKRKLNDKSCNCLQSYNHLPAKYDIETDELNCMKVEQSVREVTLCPDISQHQDHDIKHNVREDNLSPAQSVITINCFIENKNYENSRNKIMLLEHESNQYWILMNLLIKK